MKMSKSTKSGKPYVRISENPKMDTSGMADKPMDYTDLMIEYEMPKMPLGQMVRKVSQKKGM